MNRRLLNLIAVAAAAVTIGAAAMLPFAFGQDKPAALSMEEHMVSDTDAVLTIMRTWHNQISQDQAIIRSQAQRIEAVTKIQPGEAGQQIRWKDDKWEWFTPNKPEPGPSGPPANSPVEAPGR